MVNIAFAYTCMHDYACMYMHVNLDYKMVGGGQGYVNRVYG